MAAFFSAATSWLKGISSADALSLRTATFVDCESKENVRPVAATKKSKGSGVIPGLVNQRPPNVAKGKGKRGDDSPQLAFILKDFYSMQDHGVGVRNKSCGRGSHRNSHGGGGRYNNQQQHHQMMRPLPKSFAHKAPTQPKQRKEKVKSNRVGNKSFMA